jgi:hypothetical protein
MQPRKMMGFEVPGDQKIPVSVRDWNGMKLALWRSKVALERSERAAIEILERCEHLEGCPAVQDETRPCLSERYAKVQDDSETDDEFAARPSVLVQEGCRDREIRMSANVALSASRTFAPIDARQPAAGPYMAPSREYFSEIVAELGVAQLELDVLRKMLFEAGIEPPMPPENTEPRMLPSQRAPKQLVYEIPDDQDDTVQAEETAQ